MESLVSILKRKTTEAIFKAFKDQIGEKEAIAEVLSCHESFGHYQCNSALKLAKILKKKPRDVAAEIIKQIDPFFYKEKKSISKMEIAGPGFINFTLDPVYLSYHLEQTMQDPHLGVVRPKVVESVIVEFSSPNIAKELHVGHLRSTIIGDCIARLFEFLGYDVTRLNHIGDWGTQFGMLIAYMKEEIPQVFEVEKSVDLRELMQWYKLSKKRFDEDADFKKRSQTEVIHLQNREEVSLRCWQRICDISRLAFQEIYDLLDVDIIERGESFYNPYLGQMIEDLEKRGLIEVSGGAKCIFVDDFKNREGDPMPLMVQKSDGGYNYDTTDLAALRYRVQTEKADRIIYLADLGQSFHFQLVFKAAQKAQYYDPQKVQIEHIGFGLVLGSDGKKFKTRSGDTEKLIDLLLEAVKHAKKIIQEKNPEINHEELEHLAEVLGIGAVKYADLSTLRQKDYTFSYEKMLRFEGNTAVFLLYSYVRIMGIQRKTNAQMEEVIKNHHIDLKHPSEILLGVHLLRFGEILESVSRDLFLNRLCDYLYELAEKFNAFFRDCRVAGTKEQGARLMLCEASARVLKQGLYILGIKTVDRM